MAPLSSRELGVHTVDAFRRTDESLAVRILTDLLEDAPDRSLDVSVRAGVVGRVAAPIGSVGLDASALDLGDRQLRTLTDLGLDLGHDPAYVLGQGGHRLVILRWAPVRPVMMPRFSRWRRRR